MAGTSKLQSLQPVYTASLFLPLNEELVALLRSLGAEDYERPAAGTWRVRDVVAHLLHGDLRELSSERSIPSEADPAETPDYEQIVAAINRDNAAGVEFLSRLPPAVLTDVLEVTGSAVARLFAGLDPHHVARTAVLWAGETRSEVWMDMGREYTERWHHQMQIRDTVDAPLLLDPQWVEPILDLSVRALPRAFGLRLPVDVAEDVSVVLTVRGDDPLAWTVASNRDGWRVWRGALTDPDASVTMNTDTAWRLFYGMLPPNEILSRVTIEGSRRLVEPILEARSVMI